MLKKLAIVLAAVVVVLITLYVSSMPAAKPTSFATSIEKFGDPNTPIFYTLMSYPKAFEMPKNLTIGTVQISTKPGEDPNTRYDLIGIVAMPFDAMVGEKVFAWYVQFDGSSISNTKEHFLLVTRVCGISGICCE